MATRPNQDMSNTAAALRAAREVQSDTLAPELYRQATEWFFKAKHEYKIKNFKAAQEFATKARRLAEQAEFEALRNGGNRTDQVIPDPLDNPVDAANPSRGAAQAQQSQVPTPKNTPYDYPKPEGTPADEYDQRKAADDQVAARQQQSRSQQQTGNSGTGLGLNSVGGNNSGNLGVTTTPNSGFNPTNLNNSAPTPAASGGAGGGTR